MATEYKGSTVSAISYGLFGGPYSNDPRGTIIWAIFVDNEFKDFVHWPQWGEDPIKIGDFRRLIRALENEPVRIAELQKADTKPAPPSQTVNGGQKVRRVAGRFNCAAPC